MSSDGPGLTRRTVLTAGLGAAAGIAIGPVADRALALAARARRPTLWPADADVWALTVGVEGTPPGARLSVDGRTVATTAGASGFLASVPLQAGENSVLVTYPALDSPLARTYRGRVAQRPTARAAISVVDGSVRLDARGSQPDPYTSAPIEAVAWRGADGRSLGSGSVVTLAGPWTDGEHYATARVTDANGRSDETTVVFLVSGGEAQAVDLARWQPAWVADAVVYGVVPPLFGTPPLHAVTTHLDRLAALGITVLWLAPVFATLPGDFGYAVTDYFSVREDFGGLDALVSLVEAAHARGMKVILDMPLNHTSDQHPYFLQTKESTTGSHYWDFYERDKKGKAVHYFNWSHLPNLSYDSAEVQRLAIEAASFWVRTADVDGFRCDAAWGVQERAPGFWAQWAVELRRIRPDLLLLAEASARQPVWGEAGFSAAYDWTEGLGQWAWEGAFDKKRPVAPRIRRALEVTPRTNPFRFLENNDGRRRFITSYGPQLTRAAAAMLLTLPGIPCIYSGQEIGADYAPFKRTEPLDWTSDPNGLEALYASLANRRRATSARSDAALALLDATPSSAVLAYAVRDGRSSTLVAINFSGAALEAAIDVGEGSTWRTTIPPWGSVTSQPG